MAQILNYPKHASGPVYPNGEGRPVGACRGMDLDSFAVMRPNAFSTRFEV